MTACSFCIKYQPAESDSRVFGGNSNWRGPVWIPVNYLLIESLYEFHRYYGDEFRVEYPTGSGKKFSLSEIADDLARRVTTLFLKDAEGVRPVMAAYPMLQADPRSQRSRTVPRVLSRRQRTWRRRFASDRLERARRVAAAAAHDEAVPRSV